MIDALKFAVTTGRDAGSRYVTQAKEWAQELGVEYFSREGSGTADNILAEKRLDFFIAACVKGPVLHSIYGEFSYHPGMSVLRLQRLRQGQKDHFVKAMELHSGMRIFDGTLGLGSDAIIASHVVGTKGVVIGTEISLPLFFVVRYGLKHYVSGDERLTEAMRRIVPECCRAKDYLAVVPADSFDAAYFDPMFRRPVEGAVGMRSMRPYAFSSPLDREAVELALRAAPKVVIKESSVEVLKGLGCQKITGGRYSRIKYGIICR